MKKTDETRGTYATENEDSLNNARAMMGWDSEPPALEIEAPRKVTTRRGGKLLEEDRPAFVKIYTDFKKELRDIQGIDLKVWLYLALSVNRFTGDARPGLRKLAEDLNLSVNTVQASLERLETKDLLDIEKEDGKRNVYRPSDYVSARKETVSGNDTVPQTVSNSEATVSKNDGTVSTQYRKTAQPEEPEEPELTGGLSKKEIEQANAKVDAMISNSRKVKYQNRDKMPEPYLVFADLYHELTQQEPTKRAIFDWFSTFEDWKQEGLQPEHIRAAWEHANRPDGGFAVGRPGALTNTAVAMKTKMIAKPVKSGDNLDPYASLAAMLERQEQR